MPGESIANFLIQLGAIAAAVTAVGRFLIGVYKRLVTDPHNKAMENVQKENGRQITDAVSPLTHSIERLNYLLEDSQKDRKNLHAKNEEQDLRLDNHEVRITVLEDWRRDHTHKH